MLKKRKKNSTLYLVDTYAVVTQYANDAERRERHSARTFLQEVISRLVGIIPMPSVYASTATSTGDTENLSSLLCGLLNEWERNNLPRSKGKAKRSPRRSVGKSTKR